MPEAFIDLRELDAETVREIVIDSGVVYPEGGMQEDRFLRHRYRRIVTEAYRRGVRDGQKINAAVAAMFGRRHQ